MVIPKTLYKVTAYHCPKCGGITKPGKRYCEYCGRDLIDEKSFITQIPKARILVEGSNGLVNFNTMREFSFEEEQPPAIEATSLADTTFKRYVPRIAYSVFTINAELAFSQRTGELISLIGNSVKKIRFELKLPGYEMALEARSYIHKEVIDLRPNEIATVGIDFNMDGEDISFFDNVIPKYILDDMTCPNCGAPIRSRLGTCDYCGGWNEVEWR